MLLWRMPITWMPLFVMVFASVKCIKNPLKKSEGSASSYSFGGLPNGEFTLEFNFVGANSIIGYFNSKKCIQTGEISLIESEI